MPVTYSTVSDMLVGDIPMSNTIDPGKYAQDAADEINSKVGFVYETPLDLSSAPRPVQLLLKRVNNFLATGRYILAVASPTEDNALHAYGQSLIRTASATLDAIVAGTIVLEGVPKLAGVLVEPVVPLINNLDAESTVEAFYDRVANPNYTYAQPYRPYGPYFGGY